MQNFEEKIVSCIYKEISALLGQWKEAVFYAEYGVASFQMEFYLKNEQSKYVKCFDMPNISEEQLYMLFWNVNKVMKSVHKELPEKQLWSNCTVWLTEEGKFKIDYDYTDLHDCAYEYHKAWKQKYLR